MVGVDSEEDTPTKILVAVSENNNLTRDKITCPAAEVTENVPPVS